MRLSPKATFPRRSSANQNSITQIRYIDCFLFVRSRIIPSLQNNLPAPDPNELAELDAQVMKVDEKLREKQKQLKKLESELTALTGGMSMEQMNERIQELEVCSSNA